jgi:hypothetical protein
MKLKIEDYLAKREKLYKDLADQIKLLRKMPTSVKVLGYDIDQNKPYFLSDDYTLATDFQIEKRSDRKGGWSGPDGGYSTSVHETYPQFYFRVGETGSSIKINIQHAGFEKDKSVVLRTSTITDGCKDYSDMKRSDSKEANLEEVLKFFAKKGVDEKLLERLEERVKECRRF